MNKKIGRILRYVVFLSLGLGLLWWTYRDTDLSDLTRGLAWEWIFVSLVLNYTATIIRGIRWNTLLKPLGYRADPWTCIHSVAFGYLMNDIVPRSGELARCGLLNRAEHIPVDKLFGTVIIERIVDILMLGLFVIAALLIHREALNVLFAQTDGGKGNTILLVLLAGVVFLGLLVMLLRALRNYPWARKIISFLKGLLTGIKSVLLLKQKTRFILLTFGIWGTWLLMTQTMMYALEDTQMVQIGDCVFLVVAASLGMLIPAPGGVGAYHFTMSKGFEALGFAGPVGLAFAAISWTGTKLLEVVVGVLGFFAVTLYKMRKK